MHSGSRNWDIRSICLIQLTCTSSRPELQRTRPALSLQDYITRMRSCFPSTTHHSILRSSWGRFIILPNESVALARSGKRLEFSDLEENSLPQQLVDTVQS